MPTSSRPDDFKYLTVSDIIDVVHKLVDERLTEKEPIPPAQAVDLSKLEQALLAPSASAHGADAYPELCDKTAVLLYSLVKGHAWANGNKRIGTVSTFLFLYENGHWWDARPAEMFAHVTWVAASDARSFKEALAYLSAYFRQKLVPVPSEIQT